MASRQGPRDLRDKIVFALVITIVVIVGAVAVMGIVTAGLCGFEAGASCSADTIQMTTLRATLDMVLPPLIGFVAAVVGFYFGEKSGRPPRG
jgi:membrane protease YdiL (CAAX protease family)